MGDLGDAAATFIPKALGGSPTHWVASSWSLEGGAEMLFRVDRATSEVEVNWDNVEKIASGQSSSRFLATAMLAVMDGKAKTVFADANVGFTS